MDLTPERKEYIDGLSYYSLLSKWRFAPSGDEWMQGETGRYWGELMQDNSISNEERVSASKSLGWDR